MRFSGADCLPLVKKFCGISPVSRQAHFVTLRAPSNGEVIDRGLCLFFPGPKSVTGEDVLEFHLHGSAAIISRLFNELSAMPQFRVAEAGEFTRRAFVNGKVDLFEIEGLSDLLAAEDEPQRRLAMRQFLGQSSQCIERWRGQLIAAIGFVEAAIDFNDEDGVAGDVLVRADDIQKTLRREFSEALSLSSKMAGLREGLRIVIGGPPNAGKSSLMNALADRSVAIVSALPGTTRDVLETDVRIAGLKVSMVDTAGIRRDTDDPVENEGIKRAKDQFSDADVLIWVLAEDCDVVWPEGRWPNVILFNKVDLGVQKLIQVRNESKQAPVCTISLARDGVASFKLTLEDLVAARTEGIENAVVVRERHSAGLRRALAILEARGAHESPEINAHELRRAVDQLETIIGRIGVEDYLGHIFSTFCIGK